MTLFTARALVVTGIATLCVATTAAECLGQSTLIPLPTRRDMVFDHAGTYLYISDGDGWIRRYNLASGQIDGGYNLGGALRGIDIAPDDSFLLVAQFVTSSSQGTFHRVDLATGAVTNIDYERRWAEMGAWDVAIGSNGLAFTTTQYSGSGPVPLRQIDLATNAITARADAPGSSGTQGVSQDTQIHRSADHTRLYFLEPSSSQGPSFTYNAAANTFGAVGHSNRGLNVATAAVNRTGTVLATRITTHVSFDSAPGLNFIRSFHALTSGVAFDAVADRFYAAVAATGELRAYDTNSFAELYRLQIGETLDTGVTGVQQFGTGVLVASADGRHLAVATPSGVRLVTLPTSAPAPPPPTFGTPRDLVFDHAGQYLYIATAEGLVWPYHLAIRSLGTPYDVGGSLYGADIAPNDAFLLLSQHEGGVARGTFQKLDLATGAVTNITYTRDSQEANSWDVAIGSNGLAFTTTDFYGSGSVPFRQINLATNAVTIRVPGSGPCCGEVQLRTHIHRSADHTRMYFLESNSSTGDVFTYSAPSDSFGPRGHWDALLGSASAAVSRNGALLATRVPNRAASLNTTPNFTHLRSFNPLNSGVAFDATSDTLYGVSSFASQIIAYDTNTYAERFRFDVGETMSAGATAFGSGLLVASNDGRYLALRTPTTFRVFGVPAVQLVSVASVKSHGGPVYEIDLPLDGPRGVECRSGGPNRNHTMVFTFGQNLVSVGGAAITTGTGTVSSSMIDSGDPRRYIVNLTGVTNGQYIKVTLNNVVDVLGSQTGIISQQMGVLEADTNGNGATNATDVAQVKGQSGEPVTGANFRTDVTADGGAISASDISLVKSRSGTQLPQVP